MAMRASAVALVVTIGSAAGVALGWQLGLMNAPNCDHSVMLSQKYEAARWMNAKCQIYEKLGKDGFLNGLGWEESTKMIMQGTTCISLGDYYANPENFGDPNAWLNICRPDQMTEGEIVLTFQEWADKHPKELDRSWPDILVQAIKDRFPCPKKK